jgi:hypothetical protein
VELGGLVGPELDRIELAGYAVPLANLVTD